MEGAFNPSTPESTAQNGSPKSNGYRKNFSRRQRRTQREKRQITCPERRLPEGDAQETKARNRATTKGTRKKVPTDKGWDFKLWWSWRELNPRPQAFIGQIYMFSGLI